VTLVTRMTHNELKHTSILALIFSFRLFGLFMVLPVLALHTDTIPGATPALIGLAAGIYGLTQAIAQLPFGMLSDKLNRKKVISCGLIIFALGSLIAGCVESIWGLLLGRALQGLGAIGAPILALSADLTRDVVRSRAMAIIGVSIGMAFVMALILGPIMDAHFGLKGIFFSTALFCLIALVMVWRLPTVERTQERVRKPNLLKAVWQNAGLRRLNVCIFVLHFSLTACFLVLPLKIHAILQLSSKYVWQFYLPVLLLSLFIVLPLLRSVDKSKYQDKWLSYAFVLLALSLLFFLNSHESVFFIFFALLFFAAFNFLEASLPARVSQLATQPLRGTAMGFYSCSQFLGMFAGGTFGGILQQTLGIVAMSVGCLIFTLVGAYLLFKMKSVDKIREIDLIQGDFKVSNR